MGLQSLPYEDVLLGAALAFSAGVFLCISLSDLLPEVQFHSHDRLWLSLCLLCGVTIAWAIGFLEQGHMHGHMGGAEVQDAGHVH
jgi:zinc and cadmium transporter